jgi:EmrB/QacA subfamily drug resistance transporter
MSRPSARAGNGSGPADEAAPPPAAGHLDHQWRRYLIFLIVSISLFMASMDQTIVATALPAIQHGMHAQINWASWTITVYALGQVLAMPLAGKMSDQHGRKSVFVGAVALFTVASLCCGLAGNIYILVALRGVQAIGGGAFLPSATGIVSDQFGQNRDRALGLFSSIFSAGSITGPILGGVVVTSYSWRAIFLINVPIGIVLLVLTMAFVPRSGARRAGRADLHGIALLGVLTLSAMFGISLLGDGSTTPTSPAFLGAIAAAVVTMVLFARHTIHCQDAIIPLRLLRGRGFGAMNLINLLFGAVALGFAALVPLYAEQRYGIKPLSAGTLLTARAVGMITVAGLAAVALRRTGYRLPMALGFLLIATGLVLLAIRPPAFSAWGWLSLAAAVTGVGMGVSVPAANNASLQLAPGDIAAIAGLRGMFRQSGSIVAVSVSTAILARSAHPGLAQAHIFVVLAVILVPTVGLVVLVPEHRGSW